MSGEALFGTRQGFIGLPWTTHPRHGRPCAGHLDPVKRHAFPAGITGTRPVMTKERIFRQASRLGRPGYAIVAVE
ncbi:hypothetical protein J4G37_23770 [Microvirga sp. 3-52]|nr:hypothetical protein [Microvirga sp. 3-52]